MMSHCALRTRAVNVALLGKHDRIRSSEGVLSSSSEASKNSGISLLVGWILLCRAGFAFSLRVILNFPALRVGLATTHFAEFSAD
jgi:hypothetical protein